MYKCLYFHLHYQFNASLLNKSLNFFLKNLTDSNILNSSVHLHLLNNPIFNNFPYRLQSIF